MTKLLRVSPDQALPVAVLQDSTTIFGRKRVGKSNNAVVMVEEYLDLHGQVIVLDPKGDWWGMTSSADGKAEGYPLVIIGGKHGTPGVELNPLAGATTAEWVIKTGYSVILDLSQLRPRETEQFCSAFLERIRRLKVETPGPILLVIDEADELAPEDRNARMAIIDTYAAVVWMVKRGGFAGIGTLVITQRPASLSKNVTTQSETVIVLQVTGSQDLDAISDALKHHVAGETKKDRTAALEELLRSVVQLDKGVGVVVSASPELKGRILTVPFRRRKTFDSGATPNFGEHPKAPKVVAKIALAQLSTEMEKAVAEAKANDPATLRKKLAEQARAIADRDRLIKNLREEAEQAEQAERRTKTVTKTVDVPVLKGDAKAVRAAAREWAKTYGTFTALMQKIPNLDEAADTVQRIGEQLLDELKRVESASSAAAPIVRGDAGAAAVRAGAPVQSRPAGSATTHGSGERRPLLEAQTAGGPSARTTGGGSSGKLEERGVPPTTNRSGSSAEAAGSSPAPRSDISAGAQRTINAIAYLNSIGAAAASRRVAGLAGVSPKSSTWRGYLADLRKAGLIEAAVGADGALHLTGPGTQLAHVEDTPTSSSEIQRRAMEKLSAGAQRVLAVLIEAYPDPVARARLAERAEVSATSSTYRGYLADLNKYGLLEKVAGKLAAAAWLFREAA